MGKKAPRNHDAAWKGKQVDLHGLRYAEGQERLEEFMREALRKKLNPVKVIHGHGEGVMRRLVDLWLVNHAHQVGRHESVGPAVIIYFRY